MTTKRWIVAGIAALALVVAVLAAGKPTDKVTICHMPDSGTPHTMTVSQNALPAHMNHGDTNGACPGSPFQRSLQ